jgi:tetratricopeptide (TPR) repeat protein
MRAVAPSPGAATNRTEWDRFFALADSVKPARLVIDLRENTGGNGTLNRYPVQQLLRRPALDRPDRLFVIVGRRTFSAGQQFANLLEAWTQATFVGEPTGQRPSQYGDHRPLVLPASGMTVQISSIFHQAPNEFDTRSFVPPRLYTPLDSKSYRAGVDPALVAILSPDTTSDMIALMTRSLATGDTTAAERALAAARDKTVNRFRSFERDVNALGYQLVASGQPEHAIQAFRINTRAYPRSANTFDSLGETLLGAGYRDAAIATYRRALEVEPGFPPSARALQRLGVH